MNRKEKINLLNGILSGNRSARELEKGFWFMIIDKEKELFRTGDLFERNEKTDKIFTHDEVKEYIKKSPLKYITCTTSELITKPTLENLKGEYRTYISMYFPHPIQ